MGTINTSFHFVEKLFNSFDYFELQLLIRESRKVKDPTKTVKIVRIISHDLFQRETENNL